MSPRARQDNESGFSLLEALVATTLVALLAAVLFGSVTIGVRVMDSGTRHADMANQITIAQNFLRNHLAQAHAGRITASGTLLAPTFDGRSDALAFVELAPEHPPIGLKRMTVRTERTGDGLRLVASWSAVQRGATTKPIHESVLLQKLASVEFAYFGTDDPARTPAWRAEWQGRAALPSLVRLRVGFAKDRPPQDFIVALRLAQGQPLPATVNG
jgi:type II secretory pathway component PulJ